jgi:formylmethanofuran dehydrogenase subunit B
MLNCPHCGKAIPDAVVTAHSGSIGGKKTAKRGSVYFKKIAAMRKTHAGGRPKKT